MTPRPVPARIGDGDDPVVSVCQNGSRVGGSGDHELVAHALGQVGRAGPSPSTNDPSSFTEVPAGTKHTAR